MRFFIFALSVVTLMGCSAKVMHVEHSDEILKIDAYEQKLKVKEIEQPSTAVPVPGKNEVVQTDLDTHKAVVLPTRLPKKKRHRKRGKEEVPEHVIKKPEIEDNVGFDGRRPIVDPFHVGEAVTLKLSYFNIVAGNMTVKVLPFVEVNGHKSYHFEVTGQSNSLFSSFYAVDDSAETFMDYQTMLPYNMAIHVKESKQLREVRSYFDWKSLTAKFWEKKITQKDGVEEKNLEWKIDPYSQNVFSAAFYIRAFTLVPGKTIEYRVSDDKKNMLIKAHILKRETLDTPVGPLDTIKLQPEIQIGGIFQPVGEVYFWVTNDDRKFIVRIESKIKIGTIVASVTDIQR